MKTKKGNSFCIIFLFWHFSFRFSRFLSVTFFFKRNQINSGFFFISYLGIRFFSNWKESIFILDTVIHRLHGVGIVSSYKFSFLGQYKKNASTTLQLATLQLKKQTLNKKHLLTYTLGFFCFADSDSERAKEFFRFLREKKIDILFMNHNVM